MDRFKTTILSLRYSDTSIYADNWKYVIGDLVDAAAAKDFPHKNWFWGLSQLESGIMHTVCDVCGDLPYFKWLRDLYISFVNGTEAPETPSCADHRYNSNNSNNSNNSDED
jgi:hypothetical protein